MACPTTVPLCAYLTPPHHSPPTLPHGTMPVYFYICLYWSASLFPPCLPTMLHMGLITMSVYLYICLYGIGQYPSSLPVCLHICCPLDYDCIFLYPAVLVRIPLPSLSAYSAPVTMPVYFYICMYWSESLFPPCLPTLPRELCLYISI